MTASAAQRLKCTYLEAGDIMIARMPDPIGRSCIFPGSSQACVTVVDVCILRHDPKIADRAYLNWVINSPPFQRTVASFIKGSTRQRISRKNLEKIEIPLPSLPDQRRIAQILDKADALRRKRAEALTRLNSLGQSIFHEMFGAWHTERSRWDMVDLGKEMDFLTSGSRGWAEYYTETGASFIRIQNVRRGYFDLDDMAFVNPPVSAEARRTKVQPRDVLMSITADLGRAAVVPDDIGEAHINQHLAIIRNSAFNPYFLVSALTSQSGQIAVTKKDRSAVKSGLNFDDIRSLSLISPPRKLQNEFENRLHSIGALQQTYTKESAEIDSLFASLQHRAFRGEL